MHDTPSDRTSEMTVEIEIRVFQYTTTPVGHGNSKPPMVIPPSTTSIWPIT